MNSLPKVLVVDDITTCRHLCLKIVRRMGLEAIQARSGLEALAILKEQGKEICTVLMDIHMKGLNGIKATISIKRKYPHISIIAVSGKSPQKYVKEDDQMNLFDGFVQKPFMARHLMDTIEALQESKNELSILWDEIYFGDLAPNFKRENPRYEPRDQISVTVIKNNSQEVELGEIQDMSISGLPYLQNAKQGVVSRGDMAEFIFTLPNQLFTSCSARGEIRYLYGQNVGVKFTEFDWDTGAIIRDFIEQPMSERVITA